MTTYAELKLCPYCGQEIEIRKAHDVRKLACTPRGKRLCHSKCLDEAKAKAKARYQRRKAAR